MPTIAWFYGIAIQMFYNDHQPPHFHARYGRAKAVVRLSDGEVIAGELPLTGNGHWRETPNCRIIGSVRVSTFPFKRSRARMQMNELPMVDVLRLRALDGHRLWLRFTDGSEGVRDLSDVLAQGGPMVEPLRTPEFFARAFVEMGAPTWPNGFDLDPINLYMELRDAGALSRVAAE